ncbi:MAG TPA: hypothetical protein VLI39_04655 [Sedimentisphaerales bacterium]|nr:hypothetical protein [Sedimentisphaerales bacterium]
MSGRTRVVVAAILFSLPLGAWGQPAWAARVYIDLNPDWRFAKGDAANAMMAALDDSSWRQLDVPHDWSIEGPFGSEYGSGNGYAPGGIAWYRKHFTLQLHKALRQVLRMCSFHRERGVDS